MTHAPQPESWFIELATAVLVVALLVYAYFLGVQDREQAKADHDFVNEVSTDQYGRKYHVRNYIFDVPKKADSATE